MEQRKDETLESNHSLHVSHLPSDVSGEVAVRGKLQMAAVSCSVVHDIYLS